MATKKIAAPENDLRFRRGAQRPKVGDTILQTRVSKETIKILDDFIAKLEAAEPGKRVSRSEALRILIHRGAGT